MYVHFILTDDVLELAKHGESLLPITVLFLIKDIVDLGSLSSLSKESLEGLVKVNTSYVLFLHICNGDIKIFFVNSCMKKALFLGRKVNRKSNFSSVW